MIDRLLALDIGEKRIGIAIAHGVRIAVPRPALTMDETTFARDVQSLIAEHDAKLVVIGYPRNQSGAITKQTEYIEAKAASLRQHGIDVVFQDESLTSTLARERLGEVSRAEKGLIDSEAAAIILQDYLELQP